MGNEDKKEIDRYIKEREMLRLKVKELNRRITELNKKIGDEKQTEKSNGLHTT